MTSSTPPRLLLLTGPARSGKSEWAEFLAHQSQRPVVYIATAAQDPNDPGWQARLLQHQKRRPPSWQTWEIPQALPAALLSLHSDQCGLIDSLGTWVANCLGIAEDSWHQEVESLCQNCRATPAQLIFVAEETGWGVIPAYPSGRLFRDRLGELTRRVAAIADEAYLVVAGYRLNLKQRGDTLPELANPTDAEKTI